jgi:hypothetical protein
MKLAYLVVSAKVVGLPQLCCVETRCESKEVNEMQEIIPGAKAPSVDDVMGQKHPEKKFKAGAITATIWKNKGTSSIGEPTEYFTVSFERTYKDKSGAWKKTNSLRQMDLPRAVLVLNKAYEFLTLKEGDHEGLF